MKKIVVLFSILLSSLMSLAQSKGVPKFQALLGGSKGGEFTVNEVNRFIDSTLVVKDEKNFTYPVARFTAGYKFTSSYEDEETGEKKTTNDFRSQEYTDDNHMSELWRQSIKDNIRAGDELILFNIMVRMKNGKKMLVPQISFKVK